MLSMHTRAGLGQGSVGRSVNNKVSWLPAADWQRHLEPDLNFDPQKQFSREVTVTPNNLSQQRSPDAIKQQTTYSLVPEFGNPAWGQTVETYFFAMACKIGYVIVWSPPAKRKKGDLWNVDKIKGPCITQNGLWFAQFCRPFYQTEELEPQQK